MIIIKKQISTVILMLFSLGIIAQNQLTINLTPIGIIESSVTELPGHILVTVVNNNATEIDVYFKVEIMGTTTDGRIINIDNANSASGNIVNIPSSGLIFTLEDLISQYQNTQLSDYNISPPEFINQIQNYGHLPAGSYNICIEAYDLNGVLVSVPTATPDGNNCLAFNIIYHNPPIIQSPINNTWVGANDDNQVFVTWAHDYSGPEVTYRVEIVRFPSQQAANDFMERGNPQDFFGDALGRGAYERILTQDQIRGWNFNAYPDDVVPNLNPGDVLAVRVTAISENAVFLNEGRSDINVFIYGVPNGALCNNPSLNLDWSFPSVGDTLPFTDLFAVARFQPSCDNILEMNADINFTRSFNGSVVGSTTVRNYEDNWRSGPGPANYLRNYFTRHFPSNIDFFYPNDSEYEQYLPFLHNTATTFSAQRGEKVNIFGVTEFTIKEIPSNIERTQTLNLNAMNSNGIVIGMPRPELESPANDAVMRPGTIQFDFNTGLEPGNPLPPFKIFKLDGFRDPIVPGLSVNEKCVLQVARDNSFSPASIVFCKLKKIQGNPYNNGNNFNEDNPTFEPISNTFDLTPQRQFDHDHFTQQVYKDLSVSHDFTAEETLYWRVIWLRFPDRFNELSPCGSVDITTADYYHSSPVRRLIISNDLVGGPEQDETQYCAKMYVEELTEEDGESSSECSHPCRFPAITDVTAIGGVEAGSTFIAAGFTVEVTTSDGGSSSSGTGRVIIPFLNNIKLRVNFSGITINAGRQMLGGSITPIIEQAIPLGQHASAFGQLFGMDETAADAMETGLEAGGKLLSLLSNGSEISLPIGIDKNISGTRIIIGITTMTIKKDTAHLNMVVNVKIPNLEVANGFISLGAKVCMTNEGFGNDVKLYLPQDQVFPMDNGNEFRIKGADGQTNPNQVTSVEWDCNGFRALNLVGAFKFTRDWMLPENDAGTILPAPSQVEARFGARVATGGHFILNLDMDRFQIPGAEGWSFFAENAFIDYSDIENPTGLTSALPARYVHPAFSSSGMGNTWKGFYMQTLQVRTPESFQSGGNRVSFAVRNMIVDDTGLSLSARAENLLEWNGEGDFNGWSASLDTVYLDIAQNNFRQFGLNGKIGLPITETTQYLKYSAALCYGTEPVSETNQRSTTNSGEFNFVVNVKPADNIRIPISMATATIRKESYIRATIGNRSSIEVNICAALALSSSNLSASGPSMPATFGLPHLVVENLRVNSDVGFDDSDFRYSLTGDGDWGGTREGRTGGGDSFEDEDIARVWALTSAQQESSLSGFPIGLEYFSINNDGISIEPRITLSNDGTGIGASARILLRIRAEDNFRSFEITGVDLQRISLNVETSSLKLAGYLEFYKEAARSREGVRGGITLELDMGTKIGVNINAEFGTYKEATATRFDTREWYSYFYVDGLAYLSNGITIFSGLSLYGLGGGFYYHMQPSSLPAGTAVQGSGNNGIAGSSIQSGDDPPPFRPVGTGSGVQYTNSWDHLFGLKFMVLMGSNDMGKAYNFDVTLKADFGTGGSLIHLGFKGTFRVMAENGLDINTIGRFDSSPLGGFVDIAMSMPANDDAAFHGTFGVRLKFPNSGDPIIHGLGTLSANEWHPAADYLLVVAEFHIDPNLWYFNMGRPESRCGIGLTIGGNRLFEINKYLMIGMQIPLTIPSPDQSFIDIFNQAAGYDVESLDGDASSYVTGRQRDPLPGIDFSPSGTPGTGTGGNGFAMGMAMKLDMGPIAIPPFYFSIKTVMGFDINVTQDQTGTRRCAGSGAIPGEQNGRWYASGQIYCGLSGEFGLGVPYFIPDAKISIFKGSAAIILNGGLFGPDWIKGRGRFAYEVLGNRDNCEFAVEAGEVCFPTEGNPFAKLNLVQDISPDHNETNVSVYTDISAAFLIEMNREYELTETISATEPPAIRRFTPYMKKFEIKDVNNNIIYDYIDNSRRTGEGIVTWDDDNRVFNCDLRDRLDPGKIYYATVEARVREGGRDVRSGDTVYYQRLTHKFRTGREPDKIIDENVDFTYPYPNQQNFLKGETQVNKGYIRTLNGRTTCLIPAGDVSDVTTEFIARFTDEDSIITNLPATIIPGTFGVYFDVSQLKNDKLYCIQIIRKDTPIPGARRELSFGGTGFVPGLGSHRSKLKLVSDIKHRTASGGEITDPFAKNIKLPSGKVGQNEKEIYAYYFKTSKFNTFRDKMKINTRWDQVKNSFMSAFQVDQIDLTKSMSENMEWVDVTDFNIRSLLRLNPRTNRTFNKRVDFSVLGFETGEFASSGTSLQPNHYLKNVVQPKVFTPHLNVLLYRASIQQTIDDMLRLALPGRSGRLYTVPMLNPIGGVELYQDNIQFNTTLSPYFRPLTYSTISVAYGGQVELSTGSDTRIGDRPAKGGPTTNSGPTNTTINYFLHAEGATHYQRMASVLRNFAFTPVHVNGTPVLNGTQQATHFTFMNDDQREFVTRIISRRQLEVFTHTQMQSGEQEFGMKYKFPDVNGNDVYGSMYEFKFNYSQLNLGSSTYRIFR